MTYNNNTTNKRSFKHLNIEQRKLIKQLLIDKMPKTKIAKLLNQS